MFLIIANEHQPMTVKRATMSHLQDVTEK